MKLSWYSFPVTDLKPSVTLCALMVMPRSRSRSMVSRTWACISRASRPPHSWMKRSANVDLPWSTCAIMEKLRIFFIEAWVRANQALYRSAVEAEGLIYLFRVQAAVTNQFSPEQQYGDLVAVARPSGGVEMPRPANERWSAHPPP